MDLKIPPKFCPVVSPDYITDPDLVGCQCLSYAADESALLAEDGHTGFCMGKIKTHRLETNDVQHANNYALCIFGPMTKVATENTKWKSHVVAYLINRNDMELLHTMMHEAIGTDRTFRVIDGPLRGFMEADPE